MIRITLTIVLSFISLVTFAQANDAPKILKYVTQAPDGRVSMTIYDDSREDMIRLESANSFYKYQILDASTSEPLYTAENNGKECKIDKSKVEAGTYDIRLFTNDFVITSKIIVRDTRSLLESRDQETFAMNGEK